MIFQIQKTELSLLSRLVFPLFIGMALLFSSCGKDEISETTEKKYYYDLKGAIDAQIRMLSASKPNVEKVTVLGGETETVTTNELDWKKELELFVQADINKPSYSGSYSVNEVGSGSIEYKLRNGVKLPVQYLKIIRDTQSGEPLIVTALLVSENRIYKSHKNLEIRFGNMGGVHKVISYSVSGYQQLAFLDRKTFSISTKIGF